MVEFLLRASGVGDRLRRLRERHLTTKQTKRTKTKRGKSYRESRELTRINAIASSFYLRRFAVDVFPFSFVLFACFVVNPSRVKSTRKSSAPLPLFVDGPQHLVDVLVFFLTAQGVVEQFAGLRFAVAKGAQGVERFAEDIALGGDVGW